MTRYAYGWTPESPEETERKRSWQKELRGRLRDGGTAEDLTDILEMSRSRVLGRFFPSRTAGLPDPSPPTLPNK